MFPLVKSSHLVKFKTCNVMCALRKSDATKVHNKPHKSSTCMKELNLKEAFGDSRYAPDNVIMRTDLEFISTQIKRILILLLINVFLPIKKERFRNRSEIWLLYRVCKAADNVS